MWPATGQLGEAARTVGGGGFGMEVCRCRDAPDRLRRHEAVPSCGTAATLDPNVTFLGSTFLSKLIGSLKT